MLFVCYPKCTTCAKAKAWLTEKGFVFEERNIKEEKPSYEELKILYEKSKLPLSKFFNTSGLVYRSMALKEKLPLMSDEEKLQLLASDGMLVKRPIVITEKTVLVGFQEKTWEEFVV